MAFHCRTCGSNELRHDPVHNRRGAVVPAAVKLRCGKCGALLAGALTTEPVSYEDLLLELEQCPGEPSHHELGFLLSRPETQVLAALMDLRAVGSVRCLELDLEDCEAGEPEGRWAVSHRIEDLPAPPNFDLSQDIAVSSSLDGTVRHAWHRSDLLRTWSPSISFLAS